MNESLEAFKKLLLIMDELRAKCPWDKKQTIESLRHLTIEEVYELGDAIIERDMKQIKNELGDILLHIIFYSKIASEQNYFNIKDVIDSICVKLIHRHPHIYGDVKVESEQQVKQNWEQLKLKEGKKSALEGVPTSLPALVKAMRIQEKARGCGFDWENINQVWDKVEEELNELKVETLINNKQKNNKEKLEVEFGDLLFSLINYARFIDIDPDEALERTNKKFIKRFKYMEDSALKEGKKLHNMTLSEMDKLWNEAKEK